MDIVQELFLLSDEAYKNFHKKLIPNIKEENIIGVRTPVLRKFAASVCKTDEAEAFLNVLPHKYYEENNLHAFLLEKIRDFDACISKTEKFLPYIDNWATCDMFSPKIFAKNRDRMPKYILKWIKSGETYTVRFGIEMLMNLFLDDYYNIKYTELVSKIKSDEYYVNMMIAWYFATALAKQYDDTVFVIEEKKLSPWVHNKAIQKAIESNRIDTEKKDYLRSLKIPHGKY